MFSIPTFFLDTGLRRYDEKNQMQQKTVFINNP
jgi:hypothetical protein